MTTIVAGSPAKFIVTVLKDGKPVALEPDISMRVLSMTGRTVLVETRVLDPDQPGSSFEDGLVAISLDAAETGALPPGNSLLVLSGPFGLHRFKLNIETLFESTRNSLFIRDLVIDEIRGDRLMSAAAGVLQGIDVSDDYLWEKVRAAESEMAHTLRVPLVPTHFFAYRPTDAQIAELDGMAWDIDPPYDYSPDMFQGDQWGFIVTRQRPIIDVKHLRFAYPSQDKGFLDIPVDWIRYDAKAGHIRIVPSSPAVFMSMSAFIMTALTGGRSIPFMMQLEYSAGLVDAETKFPELLDAIKKMAVLKIVGDAFLPKSGSISGDGLSESISIDMEEYQGTIDHIINGPKDSNGGLMTKIHGIRLVIM
uniref:Tail protein n=1 Tax=Pseudomonas phage Touem01 TaxID=3138548 RepID=A0AAU6W388_9VIRU